MYDWNALLASEEVALTVVDWVVPNSKVRVVEENLVNVQIILFDENKKVAFPFF